MLVRFAFLSSARVAFALPGSFSTAPLPLLWFAPVPQVLYISLSDRCPPLHRVSGNSRLVSCMGLQGTASKRLRPSGFGLYQKEAWGSELSHRSWRLRREDRRSVIHFDVVERVLLLTQAQTLLSKI